MAVLANPGLTVLGLNLRIPENSGTYRTVPLDEPVDTGEAATAAGDVYALPEFHFGQLENGVRIIAVDRQGLCSSLGLFVHTGCRYLSPEKAFLPHVLELMAFRTSAHLSHLRTQKTVEQLGAAASCRVGREDVLFQVDVLREYVPVVLPSPQWSVFSFTSNGHASPAPGFMCDTVPGCCRVT
ncbi:unnamed protein product [Effrenium voratum]|nr:unnamed protein product [Effrenium voratum]